MLRAEDVLSPLHVLMVGTFTTNAFVGRLGSEPAVFWCLEWFSNPEAARVLVAHETTHAFHQELLGAAPPDNDLAWTCLFEGLAVQTSRGAFPGRPEEEYFWYGMGGFEDWLTWCREHRRNLLALFRHVPQRAPFLRNRVFDQAVGFAAFMVFGQILRDGKTFRVYEQQAVAIFVDLHVITGADPRAMFDLFLLVRIKAAGTQRFAEGVHVVCQPEHNRLSDFLVRMSKRA